MKTIVVMPGDGIGKVVMRQALRVLDAVGFQANYVEGDIGWDFWCKEGNPLPDRTLKLLEEHKIGLFGAITSKPKDKAEAELAAELKGKGYTYYSPIVGLRQYFNLDICIRPCKSFKGNPLNFIRRGKNGEIEEPLIDVTIFRQNTECLYAGVEWTNPSDTVYNALMTHPKMKNFAQVPREDLAISCRIFTRNACRRIIRSAFAYAQKFGYKSIAIAEKPNVVRETSGMMLSEAKKMAAEFPGIAVEDANIDALMMWLTKNPENYKVIVSSNMFGDIASDGFAGLVGGLGFAYSANLGEQCAIFEPTHGSAPKYADLKPSIVNPIAMILAAAMMLEYIGEQEKANRITNAVAKVVAEGKVRTYDMLRLKGSQEALTQGAVSTEQMTDAIIQKLAEV
jgi:isocitrate dehydrogenase (NAD+)